MKPRHHFASFVEANKEELNWYALSSDPKAIDCLRANPSYIVPMAFGKNSAEESFGIADACRVQWSADAERYYALALSFNECPKVRKLFVGHCSPNRHMLTKNPASWALAELTARPFSATQNACHRGRELCSNTNPAAIRMVRNTPSLISWSCLSENPLPEALQLLKENPDKIEWPSFASHQTSPDAFAFMKSHLRTVAPLFYDLPYMAAREELIVKYLDEFSMNPAEARSLWACAGDLLAQRLALTQNSWARIANNTSPYALRLMLNNPSLIHWDELLAWPQTPHAALLLRTYRPFEAVQAMWNQFEVNADFLNHVYNQKHFVESCTAVLEVFDEWLEAGEVQSSQYSLRSLNANKSWKAWNMLCKYAKTNADIFWAGTCCTKNALSYNYAQMCSEMAPIRSELLSVVMHPRNASKLKGLGLVDHTD